MSHTRIDGEKCVRRGVGSVALSGLPKWEERALAVTAPEKHLGLDRPTPLPSCGGPNRKVPDAPGGSRLHPTPPRGAPAPA